MIRRNTKFFNVTNKTAQKFRNQPMSWVAYIKKINKRKMGAFCMLKLNDKKAKLKRKKSI